MFERDRDHLSLSRLSTPTPRWCGVVNLYCTTPPLFGLKGDEFNNCIRFMMMLTISCLFEKGRKREVITSRPHDLHIFAGDRFALRKSLGLRC